MKDRAFKVKSPWMRMFVIDSTTKLDDLDKARVDARHQMIDKHKQGKSTKDMVIR